MECKSTKQNGLLPARLQRKTRLHHRYYNIRLRRKDSLQRRETWYVVIRILRCTKPSTGFSSAVHLAHVVVQSIPPAERLTTSRCTTRAGGDSAPELWSLDGMDRAMMPPQIRWPIEGLSGACAQNTSVFAVLQDMPDANHVSRGLVVGSIY